MLLTITYLVCNIHEKTSRTRVFQQFVTSPTELASWPKPTARGNRGIVFVGHVAWILMRSGT